MSNTYDKYELKRKVEGRLNLDNKLWEAAVYLLSNGYTPDVIPQHIPELSTDEVTAMLKDINVQKRLKYREKLVARKAYTPKSANECLQFVKDFLIRTMKGQSSMKEKVTAAKALAGVAIGEIKGGEVGTAEPAVDLPGADALMKALAKKGK